MKMKANALGPGGFGRAVAVAAALAAVLGVAHAPPRAEKVNDKSSKGC